MDNYYYDVAIEDGSSEKGLRPADYRKPELRTEKRFSEIKVGDAPPVLVQGPVTRTQIVKYAGASYDFNPIHHDEEFAKKSLSGGIIAHGMMVMGYLGKSVTAWLGTGQFDRFVARSVAMTRPGDTLRIEGKVEDMTPNASGGGKLRISMTAKHADTGVLLCSGEVEVTLK
ncbi:MAG: hypothetical protein EON92_01405 [Burkholderiales bacterium]|nr:MAG: hypothetical protein EON92_01405 [Burkholderiales bacterium]